MRHVALTLHNSNFIQSVFHAFLMLLTYQYLNVSLNREKTLESTLWPFCLRPVSEADAEGLGTTFLTTFGQCIYFTF
jgi:hypothetical protein